MRLKFAAILASLALALTMLLSSVAPAGAYYGQVATTWNYALSGSNQGCYFIITVYQGRRVAVYCGFRVNAESVYYATNYQEYYCPYASGCRFEGYISNPWGWSANPTQLVVTNRDDYNGGGAYINFSDPR